jgi:phosphatidyl-myo-inositol dimannoside synthase
MVSSDPALNYNGGHLPLMRILVLLPSLYDAIGGIQTYSQALVWSLRELAKEGGWSVEVLALNDRSTPSGSSIGGEPGLRGFNGRKWRFSLAAIGAARRADVVIMAHVHFAPLISAFRMVGADSSCRVAAHGIDVWKPLNPRILSGLRRAQEVWCVSDYTRQRMLAENPTLADGPKFEVLPNTLGPSYPPSGESGDKFELPQGKTLLCVSRMSSKEPYKNVEMVIRAMPEVLQRIGDARLVVVGPGDDRPRLEEMVKELALGERVSFAGRVPDAVLPSYFAACDAFVLPSTGEGFGIVYLEAMYHSKACIGAKAGGVPEVIADGETGLLIDAGHPSELAAAMIRLLQDDALRKHLGQAGKERLKARFSIARFRERLASLLKH